MKKISRASAVLLAIVLILLCAVLFLFRGQLQKNPPSARLRIVGPAGLRITSGGQVFTKPPFQLQVKPGIYLFKYSAPGFRERWEKVELRDGQYRRIELELKPVTASVLINTRPTGAELVGAGICVEKAFQPGGNLIRSMGVRVESLAKIKSMGEDGSIEFCD